VFELDEWISCRTCWKWDSHEGWNGMELCIRRPNGLSSSLMINEDDCNEVTRFER